MRLSYITATGAKSVYITPASATSDDEPIEAKSGTTLAFHHTSNFLIVGKAKIVTDAGTIVYTKN